MALLKVEEDGVKEDGKNEGIVVEREVYFTEKGDMKEGIGIRAIDLDNIVKEGENDDYIIMIHDRGGFHTSVYGHKIKSNRKGVRKELFKHYKGINNI